MSVLGRRRQYVYYLGYAIIWAFAALGFLSVSASTSPHYQLIETSLGGTGLVNSQSSSYQAQESGGIIGLGTSTGTSYQVQAGHETTNDPALAVGILSTNPSFGSFSMTSTSTATAQFEVSDYTSYGYIVQIEGTPPTNSYGKQITPLSANAGPQVGKEQYGINLVANTSPITFGANPAFGQFGTGDVATNYATANSFRYNSGDEIAYAPKSSGSTVYTISYIVDVSSLTQGGQYISTQNIVCTGTY